jgi:hypothetical protein
MGELEETSDFPIRLEITTKKILLSFNSQAIQATQAIQAAFILCVFRSSV